ncbi:putative SAUR-like auxin-responsive protein family [Hibiscus syriacus]|uniref:SAUR-like auxin-responsive protein family n=1 Tax=Hibiscus syriacus TaxID=106335 RepID=A0A6A3B3T8_HIBSY|nr:putative SAUR-like auxin-responsive protein family [Hibiscus syriacus]
MLLTDRKLSDGGSKGSAHVPKGSIAVYVGPELHGFAIPIRCLAMPAAEEFGFGNEGGLQIPCDERSLN